MDNPNLSQLKAIHGIDPISFWPLAPGWWAIMGTLCLVSVITLLYIRRQRSQPTWKRQLHKHITTLTAHKKQLDDKAFATELSLTLRQIAIQRLGRPMVAGLEGQAWLQCLTTHDPHQFAWHEEGQYLLTLPYQQHATIPQDAHHQLTRCLNALNAWRKR